MERTSIDWYQIAEVELIYKSTVKAGARPKIVTAQDAYRVFRQFWDSNRIDLQEQFKVLFLNRANAVLGIYEVSSGGITGTIADQRLIFVAALKAAAVAIVLCHNHPSGNLKPSKEDQAVTDKISQGGKLLEIKVLDHLIISADGYFSFADEGLL